MLKTLQTASSRYQDIKLCSFQGTIYAFARDSEISPENGGDNLVFNVLALQANSQKDSDDWSGFRAVEFPTSLRPAGFSLIQVDMRALSHSIAPVSAPFEVISDDVYLYLFRPSSAGTILVNRMLPSAQFDASLGETVYRVSPAWEVRFRDSGKVDIPSNSKDIQSYISTNGQPFLEPTMELNFIRTAQTGQFSVSLVTGSTGSRWHIFTANSADNSLAHYSLAKNDSDIFDLSDQIPNSDGLIAPTNLFQFTAKGGNGTALPLLYAPQTALYTQREPLTTENGDALIAQKSVRMALAQTVSNGTSPQMAFLDIGLEIDGNSNSFPASFALPAIMPSNYAFDFDQYAYVSLPNAGDSLKITGSFSFSVWINPRDMGLAEQQIIGDAETALQKRSPFLSIIDSGHLVIGFGSAEGTSDVRAVSDSRLLEAGVWSFIEASFTVASGGQEGQFRLKVNGDEAILINDKTTKTPSGTPISRISEISRGCTAVLDSVTITSAGTKLLDLPFNEIDFPTSPGGSATTPDISGKNNTGTVFGARLIPSDAPVLTTLQGDMYVDPLTGIRTYYGLLPFVESASSPGLLNGADGLLHLYYQGTANPTKGKPNGFNVVQLDLNTRRAAFVAAWRAGFDANLQEGSYQFLAQRAGTVMNKATITVTPQSNLSAGLCDIEFKVGSQFTEIWKGVPAAVDDVSSVLAGRFSFEPQSAEVLSGARVFFDVYGLYPQARIALDLNEKFAALNFVTRYINILPLSQVTLSSVADTRNLILSFLPKKANWPANSPFVQSWTSLPDITRGFIDGLNALNVPGVGLSTNLTMAYLLSEGQGTGNSLNFIFHSDLSDVMMTIEAGRDAALCSVTVTAKISGNDKSALFIDVERNMARFADILAGDDKTYDYSTLASGDYSAITALWLVLAAGSNGSIQNRSASALPIGGLANAASLFAIFQSGRNALNSPVPASYDGPAKLLQSGSGAEGALIRGSQIFQGLSENQPTNGAIALLQGTADFTDGTANLSVQGVDGGWIQQPPQMGLAFTDSQFIAYNLNAPNIDQLSFADDMTIETWVKPKASTDMTFNTKPQRILTFNKTGRPDEPTALSQYALGFTGTESFKLGSRTYVTAGSDMSGFDASIELWIYCPQITTGGDIASIQSFGVAKPVMALSMLDKTGQLNLSFGSANLKSNQKIASGQWTYIVATMTNIGAGGVAIALYVNGIADISQIVSGVNPVALGSLFVGAKDFNSNSVASMQVNGASLWSRALLASEIIRAVNWPLSDWDPSLHIRWKFVEGSGSTIKNYSIYGASADGTIRGETGSGWMAGGIYTSFYYANASEAVEGIGTNLNNRWSHVAASYKRGTALQFAARSFAATPPNDILNLDDGAAIEYWLEPSDNTGTRCLLVRDGSYKLEILPGNFISATLSTSAGTLKLLSKNPLNAGSTGYIVVTFQSQVQAPPPSQATQEPGKPPKYDITARLYQNNVVVAEYIQQYNDPVSILNAKTGLRLGQDAGGGSQYRGGLAQLRLWQRALLPAEIDLAYVSRGIPANADGLIAAWNFAEMQGRAAQNQGDTLTLTLSNDHMWRYMDQVSSILFLINGEAISRLARQSIDRAATYGPEQFQVGAPQNIANIAGLKADLDDIRLWKIARTVEQITDEQYRSLSGAELGLAGYWRFDTGSGTQVIDATGRGNDGSLGASPANPLWIASQAPISNETGAVYNILGGISTNFDQSISNSPSVIEYADLQSDAYGRIFSVMKRCYSAPQSDNLLLITGYKVGDLDTVFVGQVQTDPKIVGYFEGAPPIPSENQTMPSWAGDIGEYHAYASATTVSVTISQDLNLTITGSLDKGSQLTLTDQIGLYGGTSAGTSAGLGWEADFGFFEANIKLGLALSYDASRSANSAVTQSFTTTKTQTSSLTPGGYWEPEDQILNPTVGRRYIPDNLGTAVVKSRVADLYASRIKATGQLVKLTVTPNPDIPEDVNLIDFPINPLYIKNGSLDGQIGLVKDPDTSVSYFKPLEAYSLKRQIEREQQQLEAYFDQVKVDNISALATLTSKGGYDDLVTSKLPANPSYDWASNLSKRGIVNTYVWTAGGGTHSDTLNYADSYSESWGSLRGLTSGIGLHLDYLVAAFVGTYRELDIMSNTVVSSSGGKTRDRSNAVTLEATAAPDWFLSAPILTDGQVSYSKSPAPGKVEGYRYMAFYLPPSRESFDFFNTQLIDPLWLQQSQSPNAVALRGAQMADNGSWRVLYRVTYVGRIPPAFQASPDLIQAPTLTPPANLSQNTIYTQLVSAQLADPLNPSPTDVGTALLAVLGKNPSEAGALGTALVWWRAFLTLASDYSNPQSVTLSELREDSLGYMNDGYESHSISAAPSVRLFASR